MRRKLLELLKTRASIALIVVLFAALTSLLFFKDSSSVSGTAQAIAKDCMASQGDKATCYEQKIPALYPQKDVDEIFNVIRELRSIDSGYQFCHVLAHKLGELVVAEDPDRWIEAIPLNPSDGMCSNGFVHGVVGGRFRAEVLDEATLAHFLPDFRRACEPRPDWNPSGLDRAICYHGMGHLYMFITDANISHALEVCEEATPSDTRRTCIEGVFMQIYQPLEPDDFELLKRLPYIPDRSSYREFCSAYRQSDYVGACLREAWPLFREEISSGEGGEAFCSGQPNENEKDNCYATITAIIGRTTLNDPASSTRACSALPRERQFICFESVSRAVLEENRNASKEAIDICQRSGDMATQCIQRLIEVSYFIFGDRQDQKANFCASVPTDMQQRCLR